MNGSFFAENKMKRFKYEIVQQKQFKKIKNHSPKNKTKNFVQKCIFWNHCQPIFFDPTKSFASIDVAEHTTTSRLLVNLQNSN